MDCKSSVVCGTHLLIILVHFSTICQKSCNLFQNRDMKIITFSIKIPIFSAHVILIITNITCLQFNILGYEINFLIDFSQLCMSIIYIYTYVKVLKV
jgi:hypothetical protein